MRIYFNSQMEVDQNWNRTTLAGVGLYRKFVNKFSMS